MSDLRLAWHFATVPKRGLRPDENEDAVAGDLAAARFAVADGASEGWHSGRWASTLAAAFVADAPDPATFGQWVKAARRKFAGATPTPAGMSWYAEEKAAEGAFATVVGISFRLLPDGAGVGWKGFAVGDCCVFQVRNNKCVAAVPLEASAAFGNQPPLLGSSELRKLPEPHWFAGKAAPGDTFFLATDAAAEWFLRQSETGGEPSKVWDEIFSDSPSADCLNWINCSRDSKQLRNDDTTIGRVALMTPSGTEPTP